jgi:hypothetical protein
MFLLKTFIFSGALKNFLSRDHCTPIQNTVAYAWSKPEYWKSSRLVCRRHLIQNSVAVQCYMRQWSTSTNVQHSDFSLHTPMPSSDLKEKTSAVRSSLLSGHSTGHQHTIQWPGNCQCSHTLTQMMYPTVTDLWDTLHIKAIDSFFIKYTLHDFECCSKQVI